MREVDRVMVEDYHIDLVQMMENAGRSLAHLARVRFLDGDPAGKRVVVLAGSGGNGGGAMVCARRLSNWGASVEVFLTRLRGLAPASAHQLDVLKRMGVPVDQVGAIRRSAGADLVVDGVIGYSLSGAPKGPAAKLIRWASEQDAPVLALDVPSGLDATAGMASMPCIHAAATMTLALPKEGLRAMGVEQHVGELYLADIGVPPALYAAPSIGIEVGPLFAREDVIRLR
jgi:NAD(P)H-hydrate epimerase